MEMLSCLIQNCITMLGHVKHSDNLAALVILENVCKVQFLQNLHASYFGLFFVCIFILFSAMLSFMSMSLGG